MQPGARLSSGLLIVVAVASLIMGYLGGSGFGRQDVIDVEEKAGTVGSISTDGGSICIDTADPGEDCQLNRLEPGTTIPPTGTRVRAGFAFLPGADGEGLVGSWLYLIPVEG